MTEEQITQSLEAKELKLVGWRKYTHYSIVGFFFLIAAFVLILDLKDILSSTARGLEQMWVFQLVFLIVPLGLGLLYYKIQRNKLKFRIVKTNLTREELEKIIQQVSSELKWLVIAIDNKVIEAKTSPGFLSGSWGELITILFDKQTVLVNSICDPDKRASVVSFGRNKRNTDRLIEEIEKASS